MSKSVETVEVVHPQKGRLVINADELGKFRKAGCKLIDEAPAGEDENLDAGDAPKKRGRKPKDEAPAGEDEI